MKNYHQSSLVIGRVEASGLGGKKCITYPQITLISQILKVVGTLKFKGGCFLWDSRWKNQKMHPYISKQKGICGGRSVIEGTRLN